MAAFVEFDAGILQAQARGARAPADGPEHAVQTLDRRAVLAEQAQPGIGAFQPRRRGAWVNGEAVGLHGLHQRRLQILVETAQHRVAADDEMGFRAQRVQHARQLDRDVAGPDHGHAAGPIGQLEEAVRGDTVLGTRQIGHDRLAADRDDDAFGGVTRSLDLDRLRVDEPGTADDAHHPIALEVVGVDAVQPLDVGGATGHETGPVVAADIDVKAVVDGIVERVRQRGGMPHHLLRHAAAIDAGTAEPVVLDHRGAGTVPRGPPRRGQTAAAAADHQQIEMLSGHASSSLEAGKCNRRRFLTTAVRGYTTGSPHVPTVMTTRSSSRCPCARS